VLAAQIRQGQQQDKALQFQIAKAQDEMEMEKRKLAQQSANQAQIMSRYETVGSLTRDIMRNEGLPYDKAFAKASNALKGGISADINAVEKNKTAYIAGMKEIDANYPPMIASRDPKIAAGREQAIRELKALTGMSGVAASSGQVLRFNERGELIQ